MRRIDNTTHTLRMELRLWAYRASVHKTVTSTQNICKRLYIHIDARMCVIA